MPTEKVTDPSEALPLQVFLSVPVTLSTTTLGHSALYEQIADGTFPTPVRITARRVVFVSGEVAAWQAARIAGWSDAELRELVKRLIAKRKTLGSGVTI